MQRGRAREAVPAVMSWPAQKLGAIPGLCFRMVFVLRAVLVGFSAIAADRLLAQLAEFDVRGAEVARAFHALLVSLSRAACVRALHEAMLHAATQGVQCWVFPRLRPWATDQRNREVPLGAAHAGVLVRRFPPSSQGKREDYTVASACSKSASRSRQCSMPTEMRTRPSVIPACANSSSVKPECVVVLG